MVAAMEHETFYSSGAYADDRLNIHLGWAVHEHSSSDCMPIRNPRGDIVMAFYGEDFSRHAPDRGRENSRTGVRDREYLIDLYEQMGPSFLLELNGWFAGVLIDRNLNQTLLFSDRYGMQRIYCHESDDAVFFSSEAKSLLQVLPQVRKLNPEAFGESTAFDCVLGDKSLFDGVSVLPGGSCWTFDGSGRCRKNRYFNPESLESVQRIRQDEVVDRIRTGFLDVLPRYLDSSAPMALALTAGLDSRLIIAAADGDLAGFRSYTFAGNRDTLDVRQSQKVARFAGLQYQVLRLEDDFFADFPKLADETVYVSDGALGVSRTHDTYCNRVARNIAPVRLTGLFGSEVLRQGRILPRAPRIDGLLTPAFDEHVAQAEGRVSAYREGHPLTAVLHRDIPWRVQGVRSIEQSQVVVRSPFMDNALVELMYAVPNEARLSPRIQMQVIQDLNPRLTRIMSDRGHTTSWNPLVRRVVQGSLWALLKADYMYYCDTPNWMLRSERAMMAVGIPRLMLGYHKFEHYRPWYRTRLSEYLADTLLDNRTLQRPFFDRSFLRRAVDDHVAGRRNYHNHLTKALTLELTMRTLIESKAAPPIPRPSLRLSGVSG